LALRADASLGCTGITDLSIGLSNSFLSTDVASAWYG
jgi:hypothetical protein